MQQTFSIPELLLSHPPQCLWLVHGQTVGRRSQRNGIIKPRKLINRSFYLRAPQGQTLNLPLSQMSDFCQEAWPQHSPELCLLLTFRAIPFQLGRKKKPSEEISLSLLWGVSSLGYQSHRCPGRGSASYKCWIRMTVIKHNNNHSRFQKLGFILTTKRCNHTGPHSAS